MSALNLKANDKKHNIYVKLHIIDMIFAQRNVSNVNIKNVLQ